jgi:hypothetical protein
MYEVEDHADQNQWITNIPTKLVTKSKNDINKAIKQTKSSNRYEALDTSDDDKNIDIIPSHNNKNSPKSSSNAATASNKQHSKHISPKTIQGTTLKSKSSKNNNLSPNGSIMRRPTTPPKTSSDSGKNVTFEQTDRFNNQKETKHDATNEKVSNNANLRSKSIFKNNTTVPTTNSNQYGTANNDNQMDIEYELSSLQQ